MSKKKINELNMVSRFIGDFFDGISKGTADRLIKKAKQRGFPPKLQKQLDKVNKESEELIKQLGNYQVKKK
tara:strand:- start:110 stop:322 length:213 start_codon:yes stop_codon:yes gene_type:complete